MNYIKTIYGDRAENTYPNKLIVHLINNYLKPSKQINRILDIGTGTELYLKLLFQQGMFPYGIDLDENIAPTIFSQMNIFPCNLETDKIPFRNNYFEYILCKSTIEHIGNTKNLLLEANRTLQVKGKILILTPAWEHNYRWFYDDPTHVKPFCKKGLQDALKMAGFKNIKVSYFYHLPYTWKHNWLKIIPKFISLLPDNLRWKNEEETMHRVWIRFAKEAQLIAIGTK